MDGILILLLQWSLEINTSNAEIRNSLARKGVGETFGFWMGRMSRQVAISTFTNPRSFVEWGTINANMEYIS